MPLRQRAAASVAGLFRQCRAAASTASGASARKAAPRPWAGSLVAGTAVAATAGTWLSTSFVACDGAPKEKDRLAGWQNRWDTGNTSWHIESVNPYLLRFLAELLPGESPAKGGMGTRVLVPLCGKTADMDFLARKGYRVVGIEGIKKAIDEFAAERSESGRPVPIALPPEINAEKFQASATLLKWDPPVHATGEEPPQPVILIHGDFFALGVPEAEALVPFDAAMDRGSLVAINPDDRPQYMQTMYHLMKDGGRVLLVATEHDAFRDGRLGPPFEVTEKQLQSLCAGKFEVKLLLRQDMYEKDPMPKARGCTRFAETVYLLTKKAPAKK